MTQNIIRNTKIGRVELEQSFRLNLALFQDICSDELSQAQSHQYKI